MRVLMATVALWIRRIPWVRRPGPLEVMGTYVLMFKLTPAGRVLYAGIIAGTPLALASLLIPVHQLLSGMSMLGAGTLLIGWFTRPRVTLKGYFPAKASAGRPVRGEFILTNTGKHSVRDVGVQYFNLPKTIDKPRIEHLVGCIAPGETINFEVTLLPLRRRLHRLPAVRAYANFPFNIWRTGAVLDPESTQGLHPASLLVLPDFHPAVDIDLPGGRRYQPGGIMLTSQVGESPEYMGNREYRAGDPIRRIDFRAWARRGAPIVREYQEEYFTRVGLILDTYKSTKKREPRAGFPDLEAAISLSAAIADTLARAEYLIDLFAAGPELYMFRAGRHTAHFENVLEILADVDVCRTNPFDVITPALAEELASISTAICVFLGWDDARETLVRQITESGCAVKLFIVTEDSAIASAGPGDGLADSVTVFHPKDIREGAYEIL